MYRPTTLKTDRRCLNIYQTDRDLLWFYLNMVKIWKNAMTWSQLHDMRKHYNFIYSASKQAPFFTLQMSQRQSNASHFHRSTSRSTRWRPLWSSKLIWPHRYRISTIVQQNGARSGMCLFQCSVSQQVDWAWGVYCMAPAFPISDSLWLVKDVVPFRQRSTPSMPSIWSKFSGVWTELEYH